MKFVVTEKNGKGMGERNNLAKVNVTITMRNELNVVCTRAHAHFQCLSRLDGLAPAWLEYIGHTHTHCLQ